MLSDSTLAFSFSANFMNFKTIHGEICYNLKVTILAILRVLFRGIRYIHIVLSSLPSIHRSLFTLQNWNSVLIKQ